jgi:16S rRNA (cytosine1402-N4)-methyltransferase
MLRESIDGLVTSKSGTYVDLTFGGGGHAREILNRLEGGRLIAFDQDAEARQNAEGLDVIFVEANFRHLKRYLKMYGIKEVDGIIADLGVSSHQFDAAERGFSTRLDAELDMRMNQASARTARQIVNEYSEQELHRIFGMYGEVRNARTLAHTIVAARVARPIKTVNELKEVAVKLAPRGKENKYLAQVFQALRIEVNEEVEALREMLEQAVEVLKPGGRMVMIAYHSLEDRLVKNLMMKGKVEGEVEKDFYGNMIRPLKAINKKPLQPSAEELSRNSRARSAKLRIAEKL